MEISLLLFILLTAIVFSFTYFYGNLHSNGNISCEHINVSPLPPQVTAVPNIKKPNCQKPRDIIKPRKHIKNLKCPSTNNQSNKFQLTIGKATAPQDIFSYLHHPASPAKKSFYYLHPSNHLKDSFLTSSCEEIYLTRTGSRANQPNKCISIVTVPQHFESLNQASHRIGYTAKNTDQYQSDFPRLLSSTKEKVSHELQLFYPFLQEHNNLVDEFRRKMGALKHVTVMVANEGVMDLLLNFLCSAQGIHMPMKSFMVFVGDDKYVPLIEHYGARAMYHPALGSMPKQAAGYYLDDTFSRMMWFKTTSVYLALAAGYDVLFQDVDLVWLKDPFIEFEKTKGDVLFMDDGARTPRYTPFFVNSGFYFVRNNPRTLYLFETMTKNAATEIGQTHSHQSVLIKHIAEAHHLFSLDILVLDMDRFPSGQAYHENKKFIEKIKRKEVRPIVFHMCWTSNREDKVVYFREMSLWFVTPDNNVCNNGPDLVKYLSRSLKRNIMSMCCDNSLYWPFPVKDELSE